MAVPIKRHKEIAANELEALKALGVHKTAQQLQFERLIGPPQQEWKKDGTDTKLMWELLPFDALREVVKRFTFGAKYYGADNWKNCPYPKRYIGALLRHLDAHVSGERMDGDTGLTHISAVAWNALALVWFDLSKNKEQE